MICANSGRMKAAPWHLAGPMPQGRAWDQSATLSASCARKHSSHIRTR